MNRKVLLSALLLISVLLLAVAPAAAQGIPQITIAEFLAAAALGPEPEFTILNAELLVADPSVWYALDNPNERLTFFAPTDAAYQQLRDTRFGKAAFSLWKEDRGMVTRSLLYHMVPGHFVTSDIESAMMDEPNNTLTLPTFQGQYLDFTPSADSSAFVIDGEARPLVDGFALTISGEGQTMAVAGTDIQTVNGVIHVIDNVLIPTTDSVVQVLRDNDFARDATFDSFLSLVAIANPSVSDQLFNSTSEITVMVPTDAAFEVFATPIATMLQDINATSDVLAYHILPGAYSTISMRNRLLESDDGTAIINTSLGGMFRKTAVAITADDDGGLVVNGGAHIVRQNIDAGGAIIQVIDAVLAPPT